MCVFAGEGTEHYWCMATDVDAATENGSGPEPQARAFRYDAFISYSHSAAVGLPAALQRGLERFAKKAWQPRVLRVYRDETDLSASPGLWPEIQQALDDARFLVLLASPAAARSPWVEQEVGRWLATKGPESILIALVEGTLSWSSAQGSFDPTASTAIVPALVTAFPEEPLYVDLTWSAESNELDLHHAQFRADVATLAAPIHGRTKRELEDVDVRENRRVRRFRASAIAGLAVLLVASLLGAGIAVNQRNQAQHQTALARARELAARSLAAADPFAAAALSIEAEASTSPVLPEARDAFVRAVQRLGGLGLSPSGEEVRAHDGPATAVGVSLDGKVVATGGDDQLVRLWDTATGAALGSPLTGAGGPIAALAFADGWLAAGDEAGSVELWQLPTTQPAAAVIPALEGPVTALAWSNDGRLAIGNLIGDVVVIEHGSGGWSTPTLVARLPGVLALRWTDDGLGVEYVAQEQAIGTVDVPTGQVRSTFFVPHNGAHEGVILAAAFSPDGTQVATVADNDAPRIWDLATGAAIGDPFFDSGGPMAWSPNGTWLLSAGTTGIQVNSVRRPSDRGAEAVPAHQGKLTAIATSPDGDTVVTVGDDGSLRRWSLDAHFAGLDYRRADALLWSANDRELLGLGEDDVVRRWDLADGSALPEETAPEAKAITADGRRIAAGDNTNGDLWVYDRARKHEGAKVRAASVGWVGLVRWSPDGTRLVSLASHDGTDVASHPRDELTLWSVGPDDAPSVARSMDTDGRYGWPAAWTPDGDRFVIADDRGLSEWQVDSEPAPEHIIDVERPTDLEFSPDGHLLAVANDQAVRLWDTSDWKPAGAPLPGAITVAWSPDGRTLATASDSVTYWDLATHAQLGAPVLITPRDQVSDMAWASDGNHLAATGGIDPETLEVLEASTERDVCVRLVAMLGAEWLAETVGRPRSVCTTGDVPDLAPVPITLMPFRDQPLEST
jgi:WD40 repeat protein